MSGYAEFDDGWMPGGAAFAQPSEVVRAETPEQVATALDRIAAARAAGKWVAGYASYELGYCLSARLRPLLPQGRRLPLLLMGVFDALGAPAGTGPDGPAVLTRPEPMWSRAEHRAAFERVQDYISAGDIYQANLTFPMAARHEGRPADIYAALRRVQPVGHGAMIDLGGPVILSRSPELFFRVDREGRIEMRPMKGTRARGATPQEDADAREALYASEKDRAENLMIVDLLRNDVSRVAEVGSVRVPELFAIESYATVFQMTSLVTARLRKGTGFGAILEALFPCGSVTGAPKIRAMEIIRELEPAPREAYCGAIGWIAPDGSMSFNVAIRTLILFEDGEARLNVGGGIVHDSTAESEYEEALWKSRFATLSRTG